MGRNRGSQGRGRTDLFRRRAGRRRRNRTVDPWACGGRQVFRGRGVRRRGGFGPRYGFWWMRGCGESAGRGGGGGVIFDEDCLRRAAADRFNADGAGAREDIEEAGAADVGAEYVEESFAQAVAGWAEGIPLG